MTRRFSARRATTGPALLLMATLGLLTASCAEERPAIDRVQPNVLEKSLFTGEWYYQRTVVDVPASNGFTFVGNTDHAGMSKVTFDIQEDYLYARRSTELIKGADDKENTSAYKGEVIAAFKIDKHFDIVNAYNPTTGEKLNILEENSSDRPWYEREYMRVDWSQNLVHNYQLDFEAVSIESVPYYVQEVDPETGARHPDAPFFEEDGSYFDITSRIFAKAGTIDFPGYGEIPLCYLRGEEFTECGAGEYGIRHSFKKLDSSHQYEPLPYKGKATEVFGFFTTDRMVYNPKTGILEQNRERYLNRHNLWKTWRDGAGNLLPAAQRTLRPIVYYVNRDFPDDLKPIARKVADQWNAVFTEAVVAQGHTPQSDVFVLCPNNPVQSGDPAACGSAGLSPRIGDIRYSFMAYVPKYMTYGLLGLGPSNNDPETGEIISGIGYVYHHNNLAAYRVQEMVALLNGDLAEGEFIDGVNLTDWVAQVNGETTSPERTHALSANDRLIQFLAHGPRTKFFDKHRHAPTPADEAFQKENGFEQWVQPQLDTMYDLGVLNGEKHSPAGKLATLKGTYIEELLLDDEILMAAGHQPGTPVLEMHKDRASVARGGLGKFVQQRERLREEFAEQRNMYLPEMADDALIGLARELKGNDPEVVYNVVREAIYTAVLAHEVGHSLGLMHNFGGSDDAINYHDEYWKLRDDGTVGPRLSDPITTAEQDGKIYNYAYSSVMDYAGRYTIDGKGIGKYDRAAILFGYANKVEVYKDRGAVEHNELRDWYETDGDVLSFLGTGPSATHYTDYYARMGTLMYDDTNRELVDVSLLTDDYSQTTGDEPLSRVPYIYCSHSRSNISDSCLTRDFGADSQERMKNILDDLNTWYISRNFTRGAIGSDQYGYVGRWYGRIYNRLKKWQDLYSLYAALLPQFYDGAQVEQFLTDPAQWGGKSWAVKNAFNYLMQTLLMPDIGDYAGPYTQADGTQLMLKSGAPGSTPLGVDQARYYSTSWQGERECGYFWWECLHHIGFYLDKVMAIEALSDTQTNFVARSTPEDLREWEISYYTTFPEAITQVSAAMMRGDWSQVGPYVSGGQLQFPDYASSMGTFNANPVDPFATFSIQLYWQVLGQARFADNFDFSFNDEARVFLMGTGSAPDVDPAQTVTFTDPTTNLTYAALRFDGRVGSGHAVLDRANHMKSWSNYCDDDGSTSTVDDDCEPIDQASKDFVTYQYLDHVELIKVMADLHRTMHFGDPYNL